MKRLLAAAAALFTLPIAVATIAVGPTRPPQSDPTALALAEIPASLISVYVAASYTCAGLPWQVLAAIGFIESRHGGGRLDDATGDVLPPILGPPLDGLEGRAAIRDPGSPDGWAHAEGPMQFLSTTWAAWAVVAPDRPDDAVPDPNNAWDAIFTAAAYLCGGNSEIEHLDSAVLTYNHSSAYVAAVLAKAAAYGMGQGSGGGPLPAGSGEGAVAAALTQLGVPYVWGGETPGVGFDCSGLVQWAYAQVGVTLPRVTFDQVRQGIPVGLDDLRPGDLIFSRSVRSSGVVDLGHVALYAGGGMEVVAPHTGDVVSLRPVRPASVQAVRRVVSG